MNRLDLLIKAYSKLHNYPRLPYWVLTLPRKVVRFFANKTLPRYLAKTQANNPKAISEIIVSLTSFPARINNVWQVIECMKRQTLKPSKILLWLSKEQFPTPETIPQSLKEREDEVFEIRMVDGNIRSHKKYFYVSKEFPDNYVFLVDDDLYYPSTLIKKTWNEHLKQPEKIVGNYGYRMRFQSDGTVKSYKEWTEIFNDSDSEDLFFGSGGGTLIKPSQMYGDYTNIELAKGLTPIADDIWLNAMARKAGIKTHMIAHGLLLPIEQQNKERLSVENNGASQNDAQIASIEDYYGQVFSKKMT